MKSKFPMRSLLPVMLLLHVGAAQCGETTVTQSHKAFDTDTVSLQRGDTIHFENGDDVKHNIQISGGGDGTEDLGLQKPGDTVDHVFTHPGEYRVNCSIHPKMRLKVLVE